MGKPRLNKETPFTQDHEAQVWLSQALNSVPFDSQIPALTTAPTACASGQEQTIHTLGMGRKALSVSASLTCNVCLSDCYPYCTGSCVAAALGLFCLQIHPRAWPTGSFW